MMDSLDDIFRDHKEAVLAILKDNKVLDVCESEILAAFDNLHSELDNHDCDDECSHDPCADEFELAKDEYLIRARNINEQARIEKFIEELQQNPYSL